MAANIVINDFRDLLKIKFDLGQGDYKGVIPGVKATAMSVTRPDGLSIQLQVFEAVKTVEEIFRRRGIYSQVSDGTDA